MRTGQMHDTIAKFRDGRVTLLVATSVAEEGLDIRQSNVVIRFRLEKWYSILRPEFIMEKHEKPGGSAEYSCKLQLLICRSMRLAQQLHARNSMTWEHLLTCFCPTKVVEEEKKLTKMIKDVLLLSVQLVCLKSFHVRLMSIVLHVDLEPATMPWDPTKAYLFVP
ncbi:hypothetical protein H6P81_013154 [Aristolochia fimbriata]|uniref:Helicase C-terminal domain-containing protein n=1 Tax=Aristolochia fimbriata TaxID=158543 RepID=A0AAV7EGR5_ARIFI|nr:hypothetical protein H6P81_013154 [Aristolochia fimbriata]